jgi:hypothetical protein
MLGITEKSPNDKKQFVDSEVISTIKKEIEIQHKLQLVI